MRYCWIALAVIAPACSGSSPTGPTGTGNPPPQPPAQTVTFSGRVTATNGGQPLAQQAVSYASQSSLTDASGGFSLTVQPQIGGALLSITGTGIVSRGVMFSAAMSRAVSVDAIALDGRFDPALYRQLVRNGLDGSGQEPLRRWTHNVNLYIQNGPDQRTANMIESVARDAIPRWTNGAFSVASVQRGTGTMEAQPAWLTVKWSAEDIGHCGVTTIGAEGGSVTFTSARPQCGCSGYAMTPNLVRHELGHAMGFWHTADAGDTMHATVAGCDSAISTRELYHAAIAYRRPVGNTDPDNDPTSTVNLAPARAY